MTVGLAFVVLAIVFILINAVQSNLSIFLSAFNRNKAFFDAEVVIDQFGTEIKNAYELAQPIGPRNTSPGSVPPYPLPPAAVGYRVVLNAVSGVSLLFKDPVYCIDRADRRLADLGASAICIQIDPAFLEVKTLAGWLRRLKAYKYAFLKTLADIWISKAEAQYMDSYRPAIVGAPAIARTYDLANAEFTEKYENYNCNARTPGSLAGTCVTFKFCTKFTGACADNEFIRQTVVLADPPKTDVKN